MKLLQLIYFLGLSRAGFPRMFSSERMQLIFFPTPLTFAVCRLFLSRLQFFACVLSIWQVSLNDPCVAT